MGGISCLRRRSADGDHTHALVAQQSQSFPDNLVALLGHSRAWNCSAERDTRANVKVRYSAAFAVRLSSSGFLTSCGALPCGVGWSTYLKSGSLFQGPRASSGPSLDRLK